MHKPVLEAEILDYLNLSPGKKILDCTLGCGGHARAILEHITPNGELVGIDQDQEALKAASESLRDFRENIYITRANFTELENVLSEHRTGEVDGVLFDLGLSSFQLEEASRGFSIRLDGPLDMRMDRGLKINAGYLVNKLSERDIAEIIRNYGQERYSRRIARAIVAKRPITGTRRLAELISKAVPGGRGRQKIHPATRTFQALRIAVNRELEALERAMEIIPRHVKSGGRICVISFHSLEDRIVKNKFKDHQKDNKLKIITKKPVRPQREEVLLNPRSRSAKLRVAERL